MIVMFGRADERGSCHEPLRENVARSGQAAKSGEYRLLSGRDERRFLVSFTRSDRAAIRERLCQGASVVGRCQPRGRVLLLREPPCDPDQPILGHADSLLALLDEQGQPKWVRRFEGPGRLESAVVALDGSVFATGAFVGWFEIGGQLVPSTGWEAFVVKIGADGELLWARFFGDAYALGRGVAALRDGSVIATGLFAGHIDIGLGPLRSRSEGDMFVLKLDEGGAPFWIRGFGLRGVTQGVRVLAHRSGDIEVIAATYGAVDFGGGSLSSSDRFETVSVRLDEAGNYLTSAFGDRAPSPRTRPSRQRSEPERPSECRSGIRRVPSFSS